MQYAPVSRSARPTTRPCAHHMTWDALAMYTTWPDVTMPSPCRHLDCRSARWATRATPWPFSASGKPWWCSASPTACRRRSPAACSTTPRLVGKYYTLLEYCLTYLPACLPTSLPTSAPRAESSSPRARRRRRRRARPLPPAPPLLLRVRASPLEAASGCPRTRTPGASVGASVCRSSVGWLVGLLVGR